MNSDSTDIPLEIDSLASQLSALRPASGRHLQRDVFYRAGYAAAQSEFSAARKSILRPLIAASFLALLTGASGFLIGTQRSSLTLIATNSPPPHVAAQSLDGLPKESTAIRAADIDRRASPFPVMDEAASIESLNSSINSAIPWPMWALRQCFAPYQQNFFALQGDLRIAELGIGKAEYGRFFKSDPFFGDLDAVEAATLSKNLPLPLEGLYRRSAPKVFPFF